MEKEILENLDLLLNLEVLEEEEVWSEALDQNSNLSEKLDHQENP